MKEHSSLAIDLLGDRIAQRAADIDAALHHYFTDVREFDQREGWAVEGAFTCASWLAWKCGVEPPTAREHVRVANALGELPLIDDELRRGQLSYSKVRALTRVATTANEARLVELGRGSTAAQLEKICRLLRQVQPAAREAEERWLRTRDVANGMVRVEVQLRPEESARLLAACDVFAASAAERADALITMADATLRGDQPDRPPVEVVLHVDAATLTGNVAGAGVSAEACRRLLCDAGVVPILEDERGTPLDVGRKSRLFQGALRRALFARDGHCCRFPGCTHTRYLQGHHAHHWIDGGPTSLSNALLSCSGHHRLLHEGGFRAIADGDGGFRFLRPDGREVAPEGARPTPIALPVVHEMPPVWDGDPIDYDAVVEYAMR